MKKSKWFCQAKKKGDRKLLQGIKGKASPGRMLAIMGPSGSGKTSLLNALAGRVKSDKKVALSGQRYINDEPISGDFDYPIAFIEQESLFFPHMTVKETLDFRVELKLGRKLGKSARDDVVDNLMKNLGLTKTANTKVGNSKIRGISGGERKRLSIACEMISSPSVIFLDEPTSGLDSFQAEQVVLTLNKLAENGHTIVAVIHQPSQKVFSMFDDLLLLSEGQQMYFGEVNKARTHFESIGLSAAKEVGTAEYILDCISRIVGDEVVEAQSAERINKIAVYAQNEANKVAFNNDDKPIKTKTYFGPSKKSRAAASIFRQFKLLLGRSFKEVFRGKGSIIIKIVQQVTLGITYGGIYGLGNDQASIRDRFGLLSLVAIGASNMAVASTIRIFAKEKSIVAQEIATNMYNTIPYFVAKAMAEVPPLIVYSGIFSAIIYPLTGLNPAKGKFQKFIGLTSLHTITTTAAGLAVGSIAPNSDVAIALLPPILVVSIIFDGKNISAESVPKPVRWLQEVGLVRWGFEALCANEFEGLKFDTSGPRRGPLIKTGSEALAQFGLDESTLRNAINAMFRVLGGGWLLSILGLTLTKQKFEIMYAP